MINIIVAVHKKVFKSTNKGVISIWFLIQKTNPKLWKQFKAHLFWSINQEYWDHDKAKEHNIFSKWPENILSEGTLLFLQNLLLSTFHVTRLPGAGGMVGREQLVFTTRAFLSSPHKINKLVIFFSYFL